MAKNKSSQFSLNEGLFTGSPTPSVSSVESTGNAPSIPSLSSLFSPEEEVTHRPLGTTQGRKGEKAKRINMAFSDDNHAFIRAESRRLGMSATQFVNMLIEQYRAQKS